MPAAAQLYFMTLERINNLIWKASLVPPSPSILSSVEVVLPFFSDMKKMEAMQF